MKKVSSTYLYNFWKDSQLNKACPNGIKAVIITTDAMCIWSRMQLLLATFEFHAKTFLTWKIYDFVTYTQLSRVLENKFRENKIEPVVTAYLLIFEDTIVAAAIIRCENPMPFSPTLLMIDVAWSNKYHALCSRYRTLFPYKPASMPNFF